MTAKSTRLLPWQGVWHYVCMVLTQDFKETIRARAERDVAFREALLTEAIELLIAGEFDLGEAVLRDYVIAT